MKHNRKYVEVLVKLAGFPLPIRDFTGCRYTDDGAPHTKQTDVLIAYLSTGSLTLVLQPCEHHLPKYLQKGWKEI